jgi:hypothetical protein
MSNREPDRWKGFVLGVVGAIPGMIAMDYFWKVVYRLQSSSSSSSGSNGNQSSQASQSDQSSQSGQSSQTNQVGQSAQSQSQSGTQVATQSHPQPSSQASQQEEQHIISPFGRHFEEGESSTAAMGRIIYHWITGKEPQCEETRSLLSNLTDWGFGMLMGGVYGALRGEEKAFDFKGELLYAFGLWLFADEIGVPLMGLAKGPKGYPISLHLEDLGAHLVYGLVTFTTTKLLERIV